MVGKEFNGLTLRQKARVNLASCYLVASEQLRPQPYVYAGLKRIACDDVPVNAETVSRYLDEALIDWVDERNTNRPE